ncbi:MAG: hypothetical protein ACXWKO_18850 [Phenylobacterium sp.]
MPITTILAFVVIFGMFGAFVVGLGSVHLWMAFADRADRKAAARKVTQAVEPPYRRAA